MKFAKIRPRPGHAPTLADLRPAARCVRGLRLPPRPRARRQARIRWLVLIVVAALVLFFFPLPLAHRPAPAELALPAASLLVGLLIGLAWRVG